MVLDESEKRIIDKQCFDHDLLIIVDQKVTTLTEKIDEMRIDNVAKFNAFDAKFSLIDSKITTVESQGKKDLIELEKDHQAQIDELKRFKYSVIGALILLGSLIAWVIQFVKPWW